MTDADTQALASVINRLGASELTEVLKVIFERLEALEAKSFPSVEEGTGSEKGPSSSSPTPSGPTPVKERKSQ